MPIKIKLNENRLHICRMKCEEFYFSNFHIQFSPMMQNDCSTKVCNGSTFTSNLANPQPLHNPYEVFDVYLNKFDGVLIFHRLICCVIWTLLPLFPSTLSLLPNGQFNGYYHVPAFYLAIRQSISFHSIHFSIFHCPFGYKSHLNASNSLFLSFRFLFRSLSAWNN